MDIEVRLALLEKLSFIFSDEEKFVAFPRFPITISPEMISAIMTTASTARELQLQSDWVRYLNPIPFGNKAVSLGGPYLWEKLTEIFRRRVQFSEAPHSLEERERLVIAQNMLFVDYSHNGSRVISEKYRNYKEYKDIWEFWNQEYKKKKIEVQLSDDAKAQQHWRLTEEPALKRRLREANNNWIIFGFLIEIKEALREFRLLGTHSPRLRWEEWSSRLSLEIDGVADLNQVRALPTGFSPLNFMSDDSWLSMELHKDEIEGLLKRLPDGVLDANSYDLSNIRVRSVSFEYTTVSVLRHWFSTDMFGADFWKFSSEYPLLSDGKNPPNGDIPGVVEKLLLLRNIIVYRTENNAQIGDEQCQSEESSSSSRDDGSGPFPDWEDCSGSSDFFGPLPSRHEFSLHDRLDAIDAPAETSFGRFGIEKMRAHLNSMHFNIDIEKAPNFGEHMARQSVELGFDRRSADMKKLRDYQRWSRIGDGAPSSLGGAQLIQRTAFTDGNIGILGYLCKILPKTPSPNPQYIWT